MRNCKFIFPKTALLGKQELKLYMGGAETAENDQFRVFWKPVDSNRVDGSRLKEEQPEIYAKY